MPRSSDSIASFAGARANAQMALTNKEVADGDGSFRPIRRAAADVSLCAPLERPRRHLQDLGGARDFHLAVDHHRPGFQSYFFIFSCLSSSSPRSVRIQP
jgi:hypothetical protein